MGAKGGPSQASDPPRHAVVRLVALMFYKMLFILNVVINVFYECHMMLVKVVKRSQKGWSVCST